LNDLLKKSEEWKWTKDHQDAFESLKQSLIDAPILALPDQNRPFHVVCDASKFAIGCALMQLDAEGRERVIAYQSRKLKAAELNYTVHDKELLSIKYALLKFRVHLLGAQPFIVYTDHANLAPAMKTPHLSSRMARWQAFFAEYNFTLKHKPGRYNVVADALSRRPDYDTDVNALQSTASTDFDDEIRCAYEEDTKCRIILQLLKSPDPARIKVDPKIKASLHRYSLHSGLLYYQVSKGDNPRIVVPSSEDLKHRILYEYHDSPTAGHPGRDKTSVAVSTHFYWKKMHTWIKRYVSSCEICQRVKPSPSGAAPLHSLPIPSDCWQSVSMDFIFGLPPDSHNNTGILVIVCRLSKMLHLIPVRASITAKQCARVFLDTIFRLHGLPKTIVSDRDPRFTASFWSELFKLLGTDLAMSTAAHPQTDGQTERANRVVEDVLRGVAAENPTKWSDHLPLVEFSINNSIHSSTGVSPFYLNKMRNPLVPMLLRDSSQLSTQLPSIKTSGLSEFLSERQAVLQRVREKMAESQDIQKRYADARGRNNQHIFNIGDLVLLSTKDLSTSALPTMQSNKLQPRFLGPFKVLKRIGEVSYKLDIPSYLRLHPTFYVGKLKPYVPPASDLSAPAQTPALPEAVESTNTPANLGPDEAAARQADTPLSRAVEEAVAVPGIATTVPIASPQNHVDVQTSFETDVSSRRSDSSYPATHALDPPTADTVSANQRHQSQRAQVGSDPPAHGEPTSAAETADKKDKNNAVTRRTRRNRPPPPLPTADGSLRYIVEAIVAQRTHKRKKQLLVKWIGYDSPSWEPHHVMKQDVPDMVLEFEKSHA